MEEVENQVIKQETNEEYMAKYNPMLANRGLRIVKIGSGLISKSFIFLAVVLFLGGFGYYIHAVYNGDLTPVYNDNSICNASLICSSLPAFPTIPACPSCNNVCSQINLTCQAPKVTVQGCNVTAW